MIINCTPHAVTVSGHTFAPSGHIARATESSRVVGELRSSSHPAIPLTETKYHALVMSIPAPFISADEMSNARSSDRMDVGFPAPQMGDDGSEAVYYIVSSLAAQAAARVGRTTEDLLVPGGQIRDDSGRIVGCSSLSVVR